MLVGPERYPVPVYCVDHAFQKVQVAQLVHLIQIVKIFLKFRQLCNVQVHIAQLAYLIRTRWLSEFIVRQSCWYFRPSFVK